MTELYRVFFHELGHFVAREINRMKYNGADIKLIEIIPHPDMPMFMEGRISVYTNVEGRFNAPTHFEQVAPFLALVSYGCYFQAYYLRQDLRTAIMNNGGEDMGQWNRCIDEHGLEGVKSKLSKIEDAYFEMLQKNTILYPFTSLDPMEYVVDIGDGRFAVNLDLLRKRISTEIERHVEVYVEYVSNIQGVLNSGLRKVVTLE